MELSELQEKIVPVLKQYMVPILLGVFGLMFLGYGMITSFSHSKDNQDILSDSATDVRIANSGKDSSVKVSVAPVAELVIDVEGAVLKPGVYNLAKDARVQDALIAAGGMSEKADRTKVIKGLNLAAKIADGGKIFIPFMGDSTTVTSLAQGSTSSLQSQAVMGESISGVININTADERELDSLPGVGVVTAGKIISNRPYASIDELLSKKVVGQGVFTKIKDKISI